MAMNSRIERNTWSKPTYDTYNTYDSYDKDIAIIYQRDWFEKFIDFRTSITKIARFICVIAFLIIKFIYIFAYIYIKLCGNTIE